MSKRISRKAITLAAAAVLAAPFAYSGVSNAQTSTSPTITLSSKVNGLAPSGVTGVNITVSCRDLLGGGTNTVTYGVTNGAAGVPTYWPLTGPVTSPANPGTSCVFSAQVTGTANLDKGAISIAIGGTDRTVAANTTIVPATSSSLAALRTSTVATGLPVFSSTDVVVTLTYPQVTVKKVVTGAEPTAGFAYPMSISCTATGGAFIETVAGTSAAVGSLVIPAGPGNFIVVGGVRYFDGRTTSALSGTDLLGDPANVAANRAAIDAALAARLAPIGVVSGVVVFDGTFSLKGGESKVITINEIPSLTPSAMCEVRETNSNGAPSLSYSSTVLNANGTVTSAAGVGSGSTFRSALTQVGQTITVNNAFLYYGDLVVSKVVTGDPKTNIATFAISVSCNNGGPKDTFLLKDRQSKVYTNILEGTSCQVIETQSDGATASYSDNSGDVVNDGRVVIKRKGTGCAQAGSPAAVTTGSVAPVVAFDECWANVIITNDYNPPATTIAAAPATTEAPATTAAPAVTPAPAVPVEATPTFAG